MIIFLKSFLISYFIILSILIFLVVMHRIYKSIKPIDNRSVVNLGSLVSQESTNFSRLVIGTYWNPLTKTKELKVGAHGLRFLTSSLDNVNLQVPYSRH